MIGIALSFLAGILLVQQWSHLPGFHWLLLLVGVEITLYCTLSRYFSRYFPRYCRVFLKYLLVFSVGMSWAVIYGEQALQHRLPEVLAGETVLVKGEIVGIPQNTARVKRFYLSVHSFQSTPMIASVPRKIRLSWYNSKKSPAVDVYAGEVWQFAVRLKPPHGFFNPGGFDYEGWLFQQGIDASGYVYQPKPVNEKGALISEQREQAINRRLSPSVFHSIDFQRQKISQSIRHWLLENKFKDDAVAKMTGLVTALAVGERADISTEQWQSLLFTGTNHLMAISGLHIGLAYLFGYVLGRWLSPTSLMKRIPAQHVGIMVGVLVAVIYALLAGLSIPTQRALIMLLSFAGAALLRRYFSSFDALALALILVLLWEPLSVLSAGFWFSFAAVSVIFYTLTNHVFTEVKAHNKMNEASGAFTLLRRKVSGKFFIWSVLQLAITLALFPMSLYLFQQGSLVAPLANLVLVPFVSFLVVPVILLALLFFPILPAMSEWCFNIAALLLAWVWPFIEHLAALPFAYYVQGNTSIWQLILAISAFVILFLPSRCFSTYRFDKFASELFFHWKRFIRLSVFILLFVPILFAHSSNGLNEGEFKLTVLDVGQGSANVVQTKTHTLVFDSGARLSDRLDAGRSVVIPYLRAQGIQSLDKLMISHGDADHIGGAASILQEYPNLELSGQDISSLVHPDKQACVSGQQWRWDGVQFRVLHPSEITPDKKMSGRNNYSCVLRVSSAMGSALLTGDIEKKAERSLLEKYPEDLQSTVLVVAHHGSKTSSMPVFIDTVKPVLAIVSAGYRNRYRLPAQMVIERYQKRGIKLLNTGHVGAIELGFFERRFEGDIEGEKPISVSSWRQSNAHYWNHVLR